MLDSLQADGISQRTIERAIKDLMASGKIESVLDETNKRRMNYIWKVNVNEDFYINEADTYESE